MCLNRHPITRFIMRSFAQAARVGTVRPWRALVASLAFPCLLPQGIAPAESATHQVPAVERNRQARGAFIKGEDACTYHFYSPGAAVEIPS